MSTDLVRALALADALRRVAPEHAHLADSLSFCRDFTDADLTSPRLDAQVVARLRSVTGPTPAERQAVVDAAAVQRRATGQWTAEDVMQATEAERAAARNRGQMTQLGIGPDRQSQRLADVARPADAVRPSAEQLRQWNSMLPWQAQRERAKWAREVSERQGWAIPQQPVTRAPEPRTSARPTTEQLLAADRRRTELTADYNGVITREDCAAARPQVVNEWMRRGKLTHLGYGVPRERGGAA